MPDQKLLVGSHAPYWHDGSRMSEKSYHIMLAALPAVAMGIYQYGLPALGVLAFSMFCAMLWEFLMNTLMKRPTSLGDGNAALIGDVRKRSTQNVVLLVQPLPVPVDRRVLPN